MYKKLILNKSSQIFRSMSVVASSLKYKQFGEPSEVLSICKEEIEEPKDNEVLVKILAAPINPADINTIQGKYPVKPVFPATGGNECVAEVVSVGAKVKSFNAGDRVIPFATGLGTWTTYGKYTENNLLNISKNIGIAEAATINVNPCTAYRMLKDFVLLKPGETVIQNGANSGVGQAVHQLCKAWKISSIGIVRNRPDVENLKCYLKILGASDVFTEEEIRTSDIFKSGKIKKPSLALNCVGGKSAVEVTRHLDQKGVMVTYGGMSREPVTAPTAALIFKDIAFRGFWMTRWSKENFDNPERMKMFDELCTLMEGGLFKAPIHEMVPMDRYKDAMNAALSFKGFTGKKIILNFQV